MLTWSILFIIVGSMAQYPDYALFTWPGAITGFNCTAYPYSTILPGTVNVNLNNAGAFSSTQLPVHCDVTGVYTFYYNRAPWSGQWFRYYGNGQPIVFDTCNQANFDTMIFAYSSDGPNTLCNMCETANDDTGDWHNLYVCPGTSSKISIPTTDGRYYHLFVTGFNGERGTTRVTLSSLANCGAYPNPATVTNGTRVCDGNTVGNSCRYLCNAGYVLAGNAVRTCQASQTWSNATASVSCVATVLPGFTVHQTGADQTTVVSEDGYLNDTFTVNLNTQPRFPVNVWISTSRWLNVGAGYGVRRQLILNHTRTVIVPVASRDNGVVDGVRIEMVNITLTSADPNYNYLPVPMLSVTVIDGNRPGFRVNRVGTLSESGRTSTLEISVATVPQRPILLTLDPETMVNIGGGVGLPISLYFAGDATALIPQTVNAACLNMRLRKPGQLVTYITGNITSDDNFYGNYLPRDIVMPIVLDAPYGVNVAATVTEISATETITFSLSVDSFPQSNVTINVVPTSTALDVGRGAGNQISVVVYRTSDSDLVDALVRVKRGLVPVVPVVGGHREEIRFTVISSDVEYNLLAVPSLFIRVFDTNAVTASFLFPVDGQVISTNATTFYFSFSEPMDKDSSYGHVVLSANGVDLNVSATHRWENARNLSIRFDDMFTPYTGYRLTISGMVDATDGTRVTPASIDFFSSAGPEVGDKSPDLPWSVWNPVFTAISTQNNAQSLDVQAKSAVATILFSLLAVAVVLLIIAVLYIIRRRNRNKSKIHAGDGYRVDSAGEATVISTRSTVVTVSPGGEITIRNNDDRFGVDMNETTLPRTNRYGFAQLNQEDELELEAVEDTPPMPTIPGPPSPAAPASHGNSTGSMGEPPPYERFSSEELKALHATGSSKGFQIPQPFFQSTPHNFFQTKRVPPVPAILFRDATAPAFAEAPMTSKPPMAPQPFAGVVEDEESPPPSFRSNANPSVGDPRVASQCSDSDDGALQPRSTPRSLPSTRTASAATSANTLTASTAISPRSSAQPTSTVAASVAASEDADWQRFMQQRNTDAAPATAKDDASSLSD